MRAGARTVPDIGRLSEALSRPGIDPRVWITLAMVDTEPTEPVRVYEDHIVADCITLGTGQHFTGTVIQLWAGPEEGLFFPIDPGDIMVALAPEGNWTSGVYLFGPLPSADEKLPLKEGALRWKNKNIVMVAKRAIDVLIQGMVEAEITEAVKVKMGKTFDAEISEAVTAKLLKTLTVELSDKLSATLKVVEVKWDSAKLGDPAATEAMVYGTALLTLFNAHTHPTPVGPSGPPITPMVDGTHTSLITKVK